MDHRVVKTLNMFVIKYMSLTRGKKPKAIKLSTKYYYEYYRYLLYLQASKIEPMDRYIPMYESLHFMGIPIIRAENA